MRITSRHISKLTLLPYQPHHFYQATAAPVRKGPDHPPGCCHPWSEISLCHFLWQCKNIQHVTLTHTYNHFTAVGSLDFVWDSPGEPVPEETLTHSQSHPLWSSVICYLSSIYYDPWHPPCSIYIPHSLFPQSLSKFSLVYLLAWYPQLHTPFISSPNHSLFFSTHAHTIATCYAVVPRLCHLIVVSLTTLYLEVYLAA